jgi:hypothetical protein
LQLLLHTWSSDYSSHNKVLLFSHSTRCLDLLEVSRHGWLRLLLAAEMLKQGAQMLACRCWHEGL